VKVLRRKSKNPVHLALIVDCSRSGCIELSSVVTFVRTRSQTPLCNDWHTIVLHVSAPKESSSGSSYKTLKLHQLYKLLHCTLSSSYPFFFLENIIVLFLFCSMCDVFIYLQHEHNE